MMIYQYRRKIDPFDDNGVRTYESEKGLQYLVSLLKSGSMKFTSPAEFNDPFDCCSTLFSEELENSLPHDMADHINRSQQLILSKSAGVACFTTKANNMLMWSHYGDQHRSVCVGFDSDELEGNVVRNSEGNPLHHKLEKVGYVNTRASEGNMGVYYHKSPCWRYEDEYRLISSWKKGEPMWGPGVWGISETSIREVVLGARMRPETKEEVIALVRSISPHVSIKFIVPHRSTYELLVVDIEDQSSIAPMSATLHDANGNWQDI